MLKAPLLPMVDDVVDRLDRDGFVCLPDIIADDWLEQARAHVNALLAANGERYFSIVRPADEAGSPAEELVSDPEIQPFLKALTQRVCPAGVIEDGDVYNVLRIISGPKGESGSLQFHYDASVVTALIPIFMPHNAPGQSGELITFPNQRPFRRSVVTNMVEKLAVQNELYRKRTTRAYERKPEDFTQLLYPGNIYLFWGYRTYHGNLPCAPNSLRATMLLHYGNPHGNNALLRVVRSGRRMVEALRLKRS